MKLANIVKDLPYKRLLEDKIVPNIFENELKSQRYPMFVYKEKSFDHFELFCKHVVTSILQCEDWKKDLYDIYIKTLSSFNYTGTDQKNIKKLETMFNSISEQLKLEKQDYKTQHKINDGDFESVIDAISSNTIISIVTIPNFENVKKHVILSLLTHYTIMKRLGETKSRIKVILPLHKQCLDFDLEDWDDINFYIVLKEMKTSKDLRKISLVQYDSLSEICRRDVGMHISFDGSTKCIMEYCNNESNRPFQIFLKSPMTRNPTSKLTYKEIMAVRDVISATNANMFVHAQYTINYCTDNETTESLINDLKICSSVGGKGVVFHVGKHLKRNKKEALDTMYKKVKESLSLASKECPLLLETPAGQGTETLTSVYDMIQFYNRFDEFDKEKFGICVDTCHVFALGYDPVYYIDILRQELGDVVKLIHYNDSEREFGSCKDRHFPITQSLSCVEINGDDVVCKSEGHIGISKMLEIAYLANQLNIPMVIE